MSTHASTSRAARLPFYCTLCSKGYQRIHEYEAHENSYDHQHKKRFAEMKALQKPVARARRPSNEVVKPMALGEKSMKKGGFKAAFGGGGSGGGGGGDEGAKKKEGGSGGSASESESGEEDYDPEKPTGI